MNGCFLWNRVKAWSSIQRKFQMISEQWKFLSPFLIFAMSAVQIFKVKKTVPKVLQDFNFFHFLLFFFQHPFLLKDQNWAEGTSPLRISQLDGQVGVHQKQNLNLKCFSSLKTPLYRGDELPHFSLRENAYCPQVFKGEGQCWQLLTKMLGWPGQVPSCPRHLPRDGKPGTPCLRKAQYRP